MKKNISINANGYNIDLITNGMENFDNIVICFHGFNGDKWGDGFSGLKNRLTNSLVCSFDSCGHGDSEVTPEKMRLSDILEEIEVVVDYLKKTSQKPVIFVANSYGAYRVLSYLIKYKPVVEKIVFINPAFKMFEVLQKTKEFKYEDLKDGDKIIMNKRLKKFMSKAFIDDLHSNNLMVMDYDLDYNLEMIIGKKDFFIPAEDKLGIAKKYKFNVTFVDDDHIFQNKDNWDVVRDVILK